MSRRGLSASAAVLLLTGVAACSGESEGAPEPTASVSASPSAEVFSGARGALAARAARAMDTAYAALYTLDDGRGQPRNVVATAGRDGTWRVDVTGGALGGTADVSIVSTAAGVFQCTLGSQSNPISPTCVKVAKPGKRVPAEYSPKVERLFRQWLPVFTDRQPALAVTEVPPLAGAKGTCFSIDSISASLTAPVDIGIYCYADDGVLTAARVGFGEVKVTNQIAGPATVPLPGPETAGPPMGMDAPPAVPVQPTGVTPSA
ncbi:hypothetical protein [Paractinoplanes lichenicola]|uniref:Lipoprotein n=1 Tax=Paractinoplanes lichenicola TaxID=2802976 RepID=A0ABS1W545_9ACTN|nr:hypothetical protein [Actinoplanes lichenicola]MBL7261860.1 hypothetical protein [Actinoplanes lichenicola]